MLHSSVEAGERPFRTPWSEGGAALRTGSWNHAEDTVPRQRVTAKRPSRVRDSDLPQRDEPGAFNAHARICGSPREQSLGRPGREANHEMHCRSRPRCESALLDRAN